MLQNPPAIRIFMVWLGLCAGVSAHAVTCTQLLQDLQAANYEPAHPAQFDADNLKVGQTYFLRNTAMAGYPQLQKRAPETIEVRLVRVDAPAATRNWTRDWNVYYFESATIGAFRLEEWRLHENLNLTSENPVHLPYLVGEFVQFGSEDSNQSTFEPLNYLHAMVCAGAGVCRHLSVMLGVMLSELGYVPRIVWNVGRKDGHAWLEVDVISKDGRKQTFVVDPSNGNFVKSYGDVVASSRTNPQSFEAKWYTWYNLKYVLGERVENSK